jgi:phage gp36-like protein
MSYSTVQKIREKAGVQNIFSRQPMLSTGTSQTWRADTDDLVKFVPNLSDGVTVASSGDLVTEVNGSSIGVSAININTGEAILASGSTTGACVLATYASSSITDKKVFDFMIEANSILNGYLAKAYDLPFGVCIPFLCDLETKLAAGNLLQASFGTSATDLAEDGYRMQQEALVILEKLSKEEIGLVDIDGNTISTISTGAGGGETDVGNDTSRTQGTLFITEEEAFTPYDLDDYRP